MKSNYVITDVDKLIGVLQQIKEAHPDRVFVTGITTGGSVSAPTKRKVNYSHKLEHVFSPDLFIGNGVNALMDGGGLYIANIPRKHINPELLPK
ncbi:MAG: hypothetical protein WA125_16720 [Desulfosporosinus sp.]